MAVDPARGEGQRPGERLTGGAVDASPASRPIHVVACAAPDAPSIAALLRATSDEAAPRVLLLAPTAAAKPFLAVGCQLLGRFQPPLGDPRLGRRGLRLALAQLGPGERWCWGSSIAAATVAMADRLDRWIAVGAAEPLLKAERRRLGQVRIVVAGDEYAARCRACAGTEGPVTGDLLASAAVSGPFAQPRPTDDARGRERRRRLRAQLGADEATTLVGVVGPAVAWTDLRRAMDIVGIAAVRGARVRLVGSPLMARATATARWIEEVGLPESPLVLDPIAHDPVRLGEAIDVGLVLGDGRATAGAAARGDRGSGVGALLEAVGLGRHGGVPLDDHHRGATWQATWWAQAGLPLLVEAGSFEPEDAPRAARPRVAEVFRRDDPLRATRALLDWIAVGLLSHDCNAMR